MLTGDTGVIDKAHLAKAEAEMDDIEEQLETAILAARTNGKNRSEIDMSVLQNKLNQLKDDKVIESYSSSGSFSFPITVKKGDYKFFIDEKGKIQNDLSTDDVEEASSPF